MVNTKALIDSGAMSLFISQKLVNKYGLTTHKKQTAEQVRAVDGRPVGTGLLEKEVVGTLITQGYSSREHLNITNIGHHTMILGVNWLKKANPKINWVKHSLEIASFESISAR